MFGFLSQFLRDLKAQKLRSILTLFGIVWGTVAVVLLLAFGEGLYRNSVKQMHGVGERIVLVWPARTTKPFQGLGIGRQIRLTVDDIALLEREIPEIEAITPEFMQNNVKIKRADKAINTSVSGVYPAFEMLRNTFAVSGGRFLNPLDIKQRKRVVFIGNQLKEDLFGKDEAVGSTIDLNGIPFVVVGVMQDKVQNMSYMGSDSDHAYMPASSFVSMYGRTYIDMMLYRPGEGYPPKEVSAKVYRVLAKKLRFDPEDEDALQMWDTTDIDKILFYVFLGINILLGIGGACTLIVGGVGVANIMYIVIRERTGEIGIKMAVGAKPGNILSQFLLETLFIVALGGFIGLLISFGGVKIVSMLPIQKYVGTPIISPTVAGVTAGILGLIGLTAGYFPARRAATMQPVQALAIGKFD